MAKIYKFDEFIDADDSIWNKKDLEILIPEADRLEKELLEKYPDISLSEEETQEMYAQIMRQILWMENVKKKERHGSYYERE